MNRRRTISETTDLTPDLRMTMRAKKPKPTSIAKLPSDLTERDKLPMEGRGDVFAEYSTAADVMSFSYYPDQTGMRMEITHNWCDGKHRPLSRPWRNKVLQQLGFRVLAWIREDWGEQAVFAKTPGRPKKSIVSRSRIEPKSARTQ